MLVFFLTGILYILLSSPPILSQLLQQALAHEGAALLIHRCGCNILHILNLLANEYLFFILSTLQLDANHSFKLIGFTVLICTHDWSLGVRFSRCHPQSIHYCFLNSEIKVAKCYFHMHQAIICKNWKIPEWFIRWIQYFLS